MFLMMPVIYYPNLVGWFLVIHFFKKQIPKKTVFFYWVCLFMENFSLTFSVMDEFRDYSPKFKYCFLYTDMTLNMKLYTRVIHWSVWCSLIHLMLIILFKKLNERKNGRDSSPFIK
jgi:hypothetical protein